MFPLHEKEGQSLSWDHLTSHEELIPQSEQDHLLDRALHDALTPRLLFSDIESENDDVFEDSSVLEVSIDRRARTKTAVKDYHDDDDIEADQNKEESENEDEADDNTTETGAKAKISTRSTSRVKYA